MGQTAGVRPVKFGIGLKYGLFAAVALVLTMTLVGLFVVQQQEATLLADLRHAMASYLAAYRNAAAGFLREKEDIRALQDFSVSLARIPNLEQAMFVEPVYGRVVANQDPKFDARYEKRFMEARLTLADERMARQFPRLDFLLQTLIDDENPEFARSVRYAREEQEKRVVEIARENAEIRAANAKLAKGAKPAAVKPADNPEFFEGFLPVYLNLRRQADPADDSLNQVMTNYRAWKARRFALAGEQSAPRRRDLAFVGALEHAYRTLWREEKRDGNVVARFPTPAAAWLATRRESPLSPAAAQFLALYWPYLERYRAGENADKPGNVFNARFQSTAAELLSAFHAKKPPADLAPLLDAARAGKLFAAPATARDKEEIRLAALYTRVAETFTEPRGDKWKEILADAAFKRVASPLLHGDIHLRYLADFRRFFEKYLETGTYPFPEQYFYQKLGRTYRPKASPEERAAYVENLFRVLLKPYKVGIVRVILNAQQVRKELARVANRTVDLSVSIVLRLVFATFLLSGLLVRNIRRLADGARAVGAGDLDTNIEVRARDELGQLADQFNEMTGKVKASRAVLVEKTRMEEELKVAEQIQAALLPKAFPAVPGFEFAAYYNAQTEAGGDYYDFIEVDEKHFGLVIADVSGHGVGSGLVMTMVRSVLRAQAAGRPDPRDTLCRVNPVVWRDTLSSMFATAFYAVISTEKKEVAFASAGHNPALVLPAAGGPARRLAGEGIPLGMADGDTFASILEGHKTKIAPGDVLLLYTDGVTEAMNAAREEYQEERLAAALAAHAGKPLGEMLDGIVADLAAFTGGAPQEDDVTLLALRVAG